MIVAGFGFRKGASLASFQAALNMTNGAQAIATIEEKAIGLTELSRATGLPVIAVARSALPDQPGSPRVRALYATGSVAESAALAAAGAGAILTQPRTTSPDGQVVVAIAKGQGT